jgi:hypothetical protein
MDPITLAATAAALLAPYLRHVADRALDNLGDTLSLVAEDGQAGGPTLTQITDAGALAGRDVYLQGRNVAGRDLTIGSPPATGGEG